jgi:hypothetical protein
MPDFIPLGLGPDVRTARMIVVDDRWTRRGVAVMLSASFLVSAGGASIARAQRSSASPGWGAPTTVASDSTRTIRWPSLATHRDTIYIAANLWPVQRGAAIGTRQMLLTRVPGGPIPLPPGRFLFAFPQGVLDRDGSYHLFWAEFRPGTVRATSWPVNPATLWYAQWAAGVWTRPEKVAEGSALFWNGEQGHVVLDSTGAVHVIAAGFFQPNGFALLQLTHRDTSWARHTFPMHALYASMTATNAGLVLSYVAADSAGGGATALRVQRSTGNAGDSWEHAELVARADRGGLGSPILLARPGGGADLLWMASASPLATSQRLHYATLSDLGTHVSGEHSVEAQAVPGSLRAATTPCGPIALVELIEQRAGRLGVSLEAIRFDGVGPPTQGRIYPQFDLTASGAVTPLADAVAVVFGAVRDLTRSPTLDVGRTTGCPRRSQ